MDEPEEAYELIPCETDEESAKRAVAMVHEGRADMPMKGLLQTSTYMHAILDKSMGLLPPGGLLSQSTLVEWPKEHRLFQITDCAINIAPNLDQKRKIVQNAVNFAHNLGCECPKVAMVSAVEILNPKIQSTVDAVALKQECEEGKIQNCVVGGPLGLDNAVSRAAAAHKGVKDPVAGQADILVMPDLCSGNIFTKSLTFFAGMRSAAALESVEIRIGKRRVQRYGLREHVDIFAVCIHLVPRIQRLAFGGIVRRDLPRTIRGRRAR